MHGDERVRFCDQCSLHVYNLSAMSRQAAEALISEKEGHLCVRLYRRADGTVLTTDCGGGWSLASKRLGRLTVMACAAVAGGILCTVGFGPRNLAMAADPAQHVATRVVERLMRSLATPSAQMPIQGDVAEIRGEVCVPPVNPPRPLPATQPATQPTTRPEPQPLMGVMVAPTQQPPADQPLMGKPTMDPPATQRPPRGR